MENDKIKELKQKYSQFFQDCYCGASCGNGWYSLLDNLCGKLKEITEPNNINLNVAQIKEKFGGLRFYIDLDNCNKEQAETIYKLIAEAEVKSFKTCEGCGTEIEGTSSTNSGWIKTLCDKCMEERNNE